MYLCSRRLMIFGLAVLALSGCNREVECGQVTGTVTLDGKPLAGAAVGLMPDMEKGNLGVGALAISDENGKFIIEHTVMNDSDPSRSVKVPGAVPGWYKVIVTDNKKSSERLSTPSRVPKQYESIRSTPLQIEVKTGQQSLAVDLKSR